MVKREDYDYHREYDVTRPKRHPAQEAEDRGEAICRTCLAPIWNEGGTVGHVKRSEGWSDRIERGGDSLVCFKAIDYRHVPVADREPCCACDQVHDGLCQRMTAAPTGPEPRTDAAVGR